MDQSTQGNFQKIAMIAGFVIGVLGIFVFSMSTFSPNEVDPALTGNIVIWGTLPQSQMSELVQAYSQEMKTYSVQYVEKKSEKIVPELIEALSINAGPDLLLVPEDVSAPIANEYLAVFNETLLPEKVFKETYARSTYKLYSPKGAFSFPVAIDPIVMYVNTDILTNAGFSKAPTSWSDMPLYVSRVLDFTNNDENSVQRAVALGTVSNILHAREILLTLLLQVKNDVITYSNIPVTQKDRLTGQEVTFYDDKYESMLGYANDDLRIKNDILAEQVFVFYTSFVNPSLKDAYTWSKKAPIDRDLFASGNLGIFFGLASDKQYLAQKNPNLKYELALVPTPKGATQNTRLVNYAKVYGVSIVGKTRNMKLSKKVLEDFSSKDYSQKIVEAYNLAPARQDLLYNGVMDDGNGNLKSAINRKFVEQEVIYKAADRGEIVREPRPNLIRNVFEQIVDAFSGTRETPSEIIKNADQELIKFLK